MREESSLSKTMARDAPSRSATCVSKQRPQNSRQCLADIGFYRSRAQQLLPSFGGYAVLNTAFVGMCVLQTSLSLGHWCLHKSLLWILAPLAPLRGERGASLTCVDTNARGRVGRSASEFAPRYSRHFLSDFGHVVAITLAGCRKVSRLSGNRQHHGEMDHP